MKKQCLRCDPDQTYNVPFFSNAEKLELLELKKNSPLHTVKALMSKFELAHVDSKFIVSHINIEYRKCHRCSFNRLEEEYMNCPRCKSLNFNWEINSHSEPSSISYL